MTIELYTESGEQIYKCFANREKILKAVGRKRAGRYNAKKIVIEPVLHVVSRTTLGDVIKDRSEVYYPVASLIRHIEFLKKEDHYWTKDLLAKGYNLGKIFLVLK